jgi:hypothetical protein
MSVKEVVALFEKFMGGLADDEIEKIVGTPTKTKWDDVQKDLEVEKKMTKQDKGFRAELLEILNEGSKYPSYRMLTPNEQADRIVSLVRELVPERADGLNPAWNACRTEILSRLEEEK